MFFLFLVFLFLETSCMMNCSYDAFNKSESYSPRKPNLADTSFFTCETLRTLLHLQLTSHYCCVSLSKLQPSLTTQENTHFHAQLPAVCTHAHRCGVKDETSNLSAQWLTCCWVFQTRDWLRVPWLLNFLVKWRFLRFTKEYQIWKIGYWPIIDM